MSSEVPETSANDIITRRQALQAGAGLLVASSALLTAACGGGDSNAKPAAAQVNHSKSPIGTLVVSNWPLYLRKSLIEEWEKKHDAKMRYLEDYSDNEAFYDEVAPQLKSGKPIGRDLIIPSDWAAAEWIRNKWAEPLDKKNIPNAKKLRAPIKESLVFDGKNAYTLPYQAGITGLAFNTKKIGGISTINELLDRQLKGRAAMLNSWRDSLGLYLFSVGKDPNQANLRDYLQAIEALSIKIDRLGAMKFTDSSYTKLLAAGKIDACIAWSGEVAQLAVDNPDIQFAVPGDGGLLWTDSFLIPKGARSPYGAETFINFLYEPKNAARLTQYTRFISPIADAAEFVPENMAFNSLIFPDDSELGYLGTYPNQFSASEEQQIAKAWAKLAGGSVGQLA